MGALRGRLPIRLFFSVSSIIIAVLAVVLAGKGAAALQEAGLIAVHPVPFPNIPPLGISPSLQTLALQAGVAGAALVGFFWNARSATGP